MKKSKDWKGFILNISTEMFYAQLIGGLETSRLLPEEYQDSNKATHQDSNSKTLGINMIINNKYKLI
jgi:hypothetical protein